MFPRVSTTTTKTGKEYHYLKIVRSYRDNKGRARQKVVANLGQVETVGPELDALLDKLRRYCTKQFFLREEVTGEATPMWGPVLLARTLWDRLELPQILGPLLQAHQVGFALEETLFLLVANRFHQPTSEHGLARWLEKMYACYRNTRVLPQWVSEEAVTDEKRVKVAWRQLKTWYRAGDMLLSHKDEIERALFLRLRDLLSLKVDLVLYDLTSTYFSLRTPSGRLRRHGHSKDGKDRQVHVVVGLALVGGIPLASHVFPGNTADKTTLKTVIQDMAHRFGIRQLIFVADRGMISEDNLRLVASLGYRYLIGHPRRRSTKTRQYLEALTEEWQELDETTRFQEVAPGEGRRLIVVASVERLAYETAMRERAMARSQEGLANLKRQVAEGRLKEATTIAARADRILHRTKGYRYYRCDIPGDGQFDYQVDEAKLAEERRIEGTYLLLTNDPAIPPAEAITSYKHLSDVEQCFRELKDTLGLRPSYHQTDQRIQAHIFISHLALVLVALLRRILKEHQVPLSPASAIAACETIGIAELTFNGQPEEIVSAGGRDARRVMAALGVKDLNPETRKP